MFFFVFVNLKHSYYKTCFGSELELEMNIFELFTDIKKKHNINPKKVQYC